MKPEEVRTEILRLEDRRLHLAREVMGGNSDALEEDRRLERRIMELASTGQGDGPDQAREPGRRDDLGGAS